MKRSALQLAVQAAAQDGLLPAGAQAPEPDTRPWPVLLLVALGAWLAALPLMVVVGLLLGDFIQKGPGPYVVGALLITGAVVVLRSRPLPVFVEQLALPALLVGGGAVGMGLFRDIGEPVAAALLALLALGVAALVPRAWLRVLLGAAAGALLVVACMPPSWGQGLFGTQARLWLGLHLLMLMWAGAGVAQGRLGPGPRAVLEPLRAGALLVTLAGLAWWSGLTMLVGASLGGELSPTTWQLWRPHSLPMQVTSMLLAAAAGLWTSRQWQALRQPWCAAAALVLAGLAGLMPALGGVLLALAVSATAARWLLAGAAAVAGAWIIGAAYYSLSWPLQDKALVLVAAGATLGALAWWALRPQRAQAPESPAPSPPAARLATPRRLGLGLSVLAVLAVVNGGIWQKQQLIEHGQPVLVELAPVDPRSLMQGDFMTLRFTLPSEVREHRHGLLKSQRPRVRVQRDERGVARLLPLEPGASTEPGELTMELTPKGGQWVLVTDAWFFAEGQAERWQAARYGEFRVDGQGRALLVGLRGAQLQAL
jgi:uncharacterized membrane-anchored protein